VKEVKEVKEVKTPSLTLPLCMAWRHGLHLICTGGCVFVQMFGDMVYTYGLLIRSRRAACYAMERGVEHVPTRRIRETGYATGSQ
jgi:hypothetical protein